MKNFLRNAKNTFENSDKNFSQQQFLSRQTYKDLRKNLRKFWKCGPCRL